MKFYKQDARHNHHQLFPYAVSFHFSTEGRTQFLDLRQWCWNTWGPGIETWLHQPFWHSEITDHSWGWLSDQKSYRLRILFKSPEQFTLAKLKWY
jgi:hypothetical protein